VVSIGMKSSTRIDFNKKCCIRKMRSIEELFKGRIKGTGSFYLWNVPQQLTRKNGVKIVLCEVLLSIPNYRVFTGVIIFVVVFSEQ